MVHSYLSLTPVGVGVGTSFVWAVDQTLPSGESLGTRDYAGVGVKPGLWTDFRTEFWTPLRMRIVATSSVRPYGVV